MLKALTACPPRLAEAIRSRFVTSMLIHDSLLTDIVLFGINDLHVKKAAYILIFVYDEKHVGSASFKKFDFFLSAEDDSCLTCYFRHLSEVFKKAGIVVTSENKHEVDKTIHGIVGVPYKDCSATWREVKKRLAEDEAGFVLTLKAAWKKGVSPSA